MSYAELQVTSHFSFLRGASSPEELFATAAMLGIPALGIADRHSVAGLVHAHEAAKETGVRLVVGCRVDLVGGPSFLLYPADRAAYGRMCRLLTLGKSRAGKGQCHLGWDDLGAWNEGKIGVLLTQDPDDDLKNNLARTRAIFGDRSYCALTRRFLPNDAERLAAVADLAAAARVAGVVTGDVLYHDAGRRMLQDVVTCIRLHTTIDNAGFLKERHADRFLKSPPEILPLYAGHENAVRRSVEIVERCKFSLDQLSYSYPTEVLEDGLTAQERLEKLTWEGAARRYPDGLPDPVSTQIRHELNLIEKLRYAPYFLTVESILRFARAKGILCQGRGSAANSAVCYVLGITAIDPVRQGLLFERFMSEERREPPDIDVDFEHERREEVLQWIYETSPRLSRATGRAARCVRSARRSACRRTSREVSPASSGAGAAKARMRMMRANLISISRTGACASRSISPGS
jgi:error-prone DNA polymerase